MNSFYDPEETCPKCGGAVLDDMFMNKGDNLGGYASLIEYDLECIRRKCDNCSYEWHVLPLDHPDRVVDDEEG